MSKVDYIDHMGTDLTVVNAARVSYAKHHETFDESDERLLAYLARNGHWTPFAHPQISLRVSCNLAVAAQLKRHQVGLAVNEVSRRYVDDEPEFDWPYMNWRRRPEKGQSKQGSGEKIGGNDEDWADYIASKVESHTRSAYREMLRMGVAPEQARLVLPVATMTTFYWTGSLYAFARVCRDRLAPDAQQETREVAEQIDAIIRPLFPVSWPMLLGEAAHSEQLSPTIPRLETMGRNLLNDIGTYWNSSQ